MENNTTNQNICDTTLAQAQNDEKINNVIETALAKIEKECKSLSGWMVPAVAIYNYVKEKIKSSEEYAKLVLVETKSLDKCFEHITKIAKERAEAVRKVSKENMVMVGMGDEIFTYVDDYFKLDDEAIAAKEKAEKEAAKKAAEERKAKAKTEKKSETDKQVKEKSADTDNQISLF